MARSNEGQLFLLNMVPVSHPALLGSPEGSRNLTCEQMQVMAELATTAGKYDVPITVTMCQYASYRRALVDAAEQLGAVALFAPRLSSRIPLWAPFQAWRLEDNLARIGCTWHTLEPAGGPLEWTPSATQSAQNRPVSQSNESQA
jgi:hypothetical protein